MKRRIGRKCDLYRNSVSDGGAKILQKFFIFTDAREVHGWSKLETTVGCWEVAYGQDKKQSSMSCDKPGAGEMETTSYLHTI